MQFHSTQQSLADLIATFRSAGNELGIAIERENTELIEKLDRQMSAQFDALLNFSPSNVEDALELTEFLLEQLVPHGAETTLSEQTKAKIISLVSAGFEMKAGAPANGRRPSEGSNPSIDSSGSKSTS